MGLRRHRLFACAIGIVLTAAAPTASAQPGGAPLDLDRANAMATELSLGAGRSIAVVLDDATPGGGGGRIGVLELDGKVRLGTLELGRAEGESRYDVGIEASAGGWRLRIHEHAGSKDVGSTPLSHRQVQGDGAQMAVVLLPVSRDAARLVLRWPGHEVSGDVVFLRRLAARAASSNGRPNEPVKRGHFTEANPRLVRAMHLSQANYAGLGLPGGKTVALWYPRLAADGLDFPGLERAAEGDVIAFTQAPPIRLRTDVPLLVGGRPVGLGNLAPGFHGSYGLWLKRGANGWRIVFNNLPDVWGSQHDPDADVLEVEVSHAREGDPSRPFGAALIAESPERAELRLHWGPHDWTVPVRLNGAGAR